ncbi:piggyBac transposable element-derived protein 3-like [Anthonomus grandis grandis]|uniref:piggyBac transposable element-derived protein 3-like n=1 Tax=Anthonomus grandis grandis TaxID=2921223 RepID=UPI00216661E2|nr:piggyBac transposable element-derived protein 3-like [Anthonomus grandis grandis]
MAVLPPVNANEYNTDEDSSEENEVDINNLPGSQLMAQVEVIFENKGSNQTTVESDFDSDDNLPLSTFLTKKRPKLSTSKPNYSWKKGDINQDFPEWVNTSGPKNSLPPLELFFQFIDDEIIDLVVKYSNLNAIQHNRQGDI